MAEPEKISDTLKPKLETMKDNSSLTKKNKHGGARKGAGHPKGKKLPQTIEKEAALDQFRLRVAQQADNLLSIQMSLAKGIQLLYRVDFGSQGGRLPSVLVTDPDEIKTAIDNDFAGDEGQSYYFLTTKEPDLRAIDSMLDRTFGKAKQVIEGELNGIINVALVEFVGPDEDSQD